MIDQGDYTKFELACADVYVPPSTEDWAGRDWKCEATGQLMM